MNYTKIGNERGTIFCIHGNSSSAKIFENLVNSENIPHTIIAIDLPGHGSNQATDLDVEKLSLESHKKYLIEEISKIDDEILLVGNSLGGHLAIEIANKVSNLKGLVIMGSPPVKKPINFEEAFLPTEALNTFLTEIPKEEEIINAFNAVVINKAGTSNMISEFKKANPLVRKATAIDLTENKFLNQHTMFTELQAPKYIIAGDSDISVNRNYLEVVKKDCKTSCSLIDIDNCGHYPSLDKPFEFNGIIEKITKEVFN